MAENELSLINKVELRIALAENDKQFESSLQLYLAPLLLKLASPHGQVRSSILKIIQQLLPRIAAARTIKLPLVALLNQVKTPNISPGSDATSLRLFSLIFVSRGIERLSDLEKKDLIPIVIEGISKFPGNVSARLFNVLCKLLENWKSPSLDTEDYNNMSRFLHFIDNPNDENYLSQLISKFFLLQATPNGSIVLPGLSISDNEFFNKDAGIQYKTNNEIFQIKLRLLEFLKAGFKDENLVIPYLIASVDSSSIINDSAEVLLKKLTINYEDERLINNLVDLFLGDQTRPPVSATVQEKIMQNLLKSKLVTTIPRVAEISSIGLTSEYSRLKQSTVQFIKWVSSNDSEFSESQAKTLREFNSNMASQLRNNLITEGWPQLDSSQIKNYSTSISQRQLQYETLGNILRSSPELILDDISYIEFLFQSLEGELPDLRATIQDALSSLTVLLPQLSSQSKQNLKILVKRYLSQMSSDNSENWHSCRYVAIKYINSSFPFEDSQARYLCILGTAKENRSDTIEEAIKGLHPHWFNILQSSNTLEFKSTRDLLGENSKVVFPTFEQFISVLQNELTEANGTNNTIYQSLAKGIKFGLQILVMQAISNSNSNSNTVVVTDEDWEIRLDKALEVDKTVQQLLVEEIKHIAESDINMTDNQENNIFNQYLSIIFNTLIGQYFDTARISLDITYVEIFTKLITFSPPRVIEQLIPLIDKIIELINKQVLNDKSLSLVCNSLGIISSHPYISRDYLLRLFNQLTINDIPSYMVKNRLLTISYLISRLYLRKRIDIIDTSELIKFCDILLNHLKNVDSSLYYTVLECINQLAIFGVLGPVVNQELNSFVLQFIESIKLKVKKCDEQSVITLSYLTLALGKSTSTSEEINQYEQMIYDTHISKQVEYTFTSGEAFSVMGCGWQSTYLVKYLDIQGEDIIYIPNDISRLSIILQVVLQACANTKPSLRRAGCIWLLSLTQYCGHLSIIQQKSSEIHISFMRFLADRDELIQESASRGLSLVYEMGDYDLKDTLVRGLLKSFTDSSSTTNFTSGSIDKDTELFEPELLKTNEGSVSTYKDVLNLASDVGDPSLVYKFMSLAKSSALWSSRKGLAFGLGSILSKAQLDKMLSTNKNLSNRLIPKLFRYRYDPNTSVQKSMNDIWNALISDTSKTVKENFDIILPELLKGMGNKEWRVRQASTVGLSDLVQIVSIESYEYKLEEIWNMSFRVMDDIKESVRKEGIKLTKSLATILVRIIDPKNKSSDSPHESIDILENLIPFLLGNKGLLSDSEDVRNFALDTILKICKTGGKSIKIYVPKLIENFINLMSTLEPEVINYLVLNADKYNLKSNDIYAKRLQSLGHSPMMDAIEKLLDELDDSLMEDFINKLESAIKRSVGLPSKVCGSRVLVQLVSKHYHLIKPFGDKLLKVTIQQIKDKNDTISSSYSTAAGYLCKISSISSIINYSKFINKLYFESEDERSREIASIASENVSKYCGHDKFELIASAFLPLSFIGKYDSNKIVKLNFEREWIENTSGSNSSIKLYMNEILEFFKIYVQSNKFEIRKILATSISNLSNLIDNSNQLSSETIIELLKLLLESNKGKSWEGKELVFDSLISFSITCKEFLRNPLQLELLNQINRVIIVEAKRRNKTYQKHVIKLVGKYIHEFNNDNLEVIEIYITIMGQVLSDNYSLDEDEDEDMTSDNEDLKFNLTTKENLDLEESKLSFIKNLGESFYIINDKQYNHELIEFILNQFYSIFHSRLITNTWRSKLQVMESLSKILIQLKDSHPIKEIDNIFKNWIQLSELCLTNDNIENVKIQFIRLSSNLQPILEDLNELNKLNQVIEKLNQFKQTETSSIIHTELSKFFT
ncbi:proteasome stabiliser-domain-containing protein [Scheffersomyces amazonensis]|uniref:proteasome stabiliser-domain-containing protein n=1 Tax=Scheffersomyces amazonensis TaxID=1078765 RepID=UPI00315DFD93